MDAGEVEGPTIRRQAAKQYVGRSNSQIWTNRRAHQLAADRSHRLNRWCEALLTSDVNLFGALPLTLSCRSGDYREFGQLSIQSFKCAARMNVRLPRFTARSLPSPISLYNLL